MQHTVLLAALLGSVSAAPTTASEFSSSELLPRAVAPNWQAQLNLHKTSPATPSGFPKVVFYEHFANYKSGAQPSRDKWTFDVGTSYPGGAPQWGTGEKQIYTNKTENIYITKNGTLQIVPVKKTDAKGKVTWTSARIETTKKYDFACPAGKKIRIQAALMLGDNAPSRQMGIWPAFWMLGNKFRGNYQNWPSIGEIDIIDTVNGSPRSWHTVHCGFAPGGPCNEFNGLGTNSPFSHGKFHLASVDIDRTNAGGAWSGEKLVWRIDGQVVYTLVGSQVKNQTAWTALTRSAKFVLLNVAVGGSFPDAAANPKPGPNSTPNAQTLGGVKSGLEARYVAVFSN
ncbi:Concanavalin A-like lectin/glucanase domain containing protein [Naviculisporaceae sp. PSN 640]